MKRRQLFGAKAGCDEENGPGNNNNNDDDGNVDDEKLYACSLTVHESLGWALFTGCKSLTGLGEKLLSAYACHKYSMKRNDGDLYKIASGLKNPTLTTDKRLSNVVIIRFEASFKVGNSSVVYENPAEMVKEMEYRRYVDDNHPLLVEKLGGRGSSDLSNMKFHSREFHISFGDYRLIINVKNDTFHMQYKKFISKREKFLPSTLTREILYASDESPAYVEPHFVVSERAKTIIGVASFLECKNLSVKTVYAKYKDSICLYQRVQPDNFSQSYPFAIECELVSGGGKMRNRDALGKFLDVCCQFDATVSKRGTNFSLIDDGLNHTLAVSSKPIHAVNVPKDGIYFKKFDGVPATLTFFPSYFVVRNSLKSESFEHSLPRKVYYILKNYQFLVESELYVSKYQNEFLKKSLKKPNPLVIIDVETTAFDATERLAMIQALRISLARFLYEYFIFFQGEKCNGVLKKPEEKNAISLSRISIYEVVLSRDNKTIVERIVKPRDDKTKANSCKMIDLICDIKRKDDEN